MLKVMIIRHAEKPGDHEGRLAPFGVDEHGRPDPASLTPLGWQRAGALAAWFGRPSLTTPAIARPTALFAPQRRESSRRSELTLQPLARFLGLDVSTAVPLGAEADLVRAVLACRGPVLIAWQHRMLPRLPPLLDGPHLRSPREWPTDRFDVTWVLDRDATGAWRMEQVPQLLLAGDSPEPLPLD